MPISHTYTELGTVVPSYKPLPRSAEFQSEAALEQAFIASLTDIGYEYLTVGSEEALIANLRRRIEALNGIAFTEGEWNRLFRDYIALAGDDVLAKARRLQEDWYYALPLDPGRTVNGSNVKNIFLIDKEDPGRNSLQVINQYTADGSHQNRYDVTVLVNGLPLVHIELKKRGVDLMQAFNQISRYKRESFWSGCGLYEYIQLFVISNGTHTKYYSNTTRSGHISRRSSAASAGSSYKFTSFWADRTNRPIRDLMDFAVTFMKPETLLSVLTRYCILTEKGELMVMRPYQICASEAVLNKINKAYREDLYGDRQWSEALRAEAAADPGRAPDKKSGGYIWHATGSGKTLTSFQTARAAVRLPFIHKVMFVVDRKDLDYQTMLEYDRFQQGAADGTGNTAALKAKLEDNGDKILITTIQKLTRFIKSNPGHPVFSRHIVIIFDECHRSHFGEMHRLITDNFANYYIFGFTGTPIMVPTGSNPDALTTALLFGKKLHAYTINDAIRDENVLPFKVDYIKTVKKHREGLPDEEVYGIDYQSAWEKNYRLRIISGNILDNYDKMTRKGRFNGILATDGIKTCIMYYRFLKQLAREREKDIKLAAIFTYDPNREDDDFDDIGDISAGNLDVSAREFLDKEAIRDYNEAFGTHYSTDKGRFESYYKDISRRMKNKEIDLLIVCDMFLTGFDAKCLNTMWIDKSLYMHKVIQTFSRTNRIWDSNKPYGNIICYRNLTREVDEAVRLYSNPDSEIGILIKPFEEYYKVYAHECGRLRSAFPLTREPVTDEEKKLFVGIFSAIRRLMVTLSAFQEYEGKALLTEGELQDYQSIYLDIYRKLREQKEDPADIGDDLVFELEILRHDDINIDYILRLIRELGSDSAKNRELKAEIERQVKASPLLRSKLELINKFIAELSNKGYSPEDWNEFMEEERRQALERIISRERLNEERTRLLIEEALASGGYINTQGPDIAALLPPLPIFGGAREKAIRRVISSLSEYMEVYYY